MLDAHKQLIQYGALGTFMAFVLGTGAWLLHVFVPVWIDTNAQQRKLLIQQTAALQSISASMEDFRIELHDELESQTSRVSLAIQKRNR